MGWPCVSEGRRVLVVSIDCVSGSKNKKQTVGINLYAGRLRRMTAGITVDYRLFQLCHWINKRLHERKQIKFGEKWPSLIEGIYLVLCMRTRTHTHLYYPVIVMISSAEVL